MAVSYTHLDVYKRQAQKECDETLYWLELMKETGYLTEIEFSSMAKDCNELMKIIRSIILTRKANLKNERMIKI